MHYRFLWETFKLQSFPDFCVQGTLWFQEYLMPDPRWQLGYGSRKTNLHDSKTSLRSWSHTWVTVTASSQNNNHHHTRCRKKFKDWPTNQPLIAPNSFDLLHSQHLLQLPPPAPNLPARHWTEQTGEHHLSGVIPPATPRINQHNP
jgi:hypothetical protein